MISKRLLIILGVMILGGLVILLTMIRQRKISLRHALLWIVMIIGLICFVSIPGSLKALSSLLGIYSEINMVFFLGFLISTALIFYLAVLTDRDSERIRKMTQKMALMEHEIQELKKQAEHD